MCVCVATRTEEKRSPTKFTIHQNASAKIESRNEDLWSTTVPPCRYGITVNPTMLGKSRTAFNDNLLDEYEVKQDVQQHFQSLASGAEIGGLRFRRIES